MASYLEYSRNVFGFCPDHVALRHRSDVEYFAKMGRNIALVLMLQIIRPLIHLGNSNNYELVTKLCTYFRSRMSVGSAFCLSASELKNMIFLLETMT